MSDCSEHEIISKFMMDNKNILKIKLMQMAKKTGNKYFLYEAKTISLQALGLLS